jgi:hypothetical protein
MKLLHLQSVVHPRLRLADMTQPSSPDLREKAQRREKSNCKFMTAIALDVRVRYTALLHDMNQSERKSHRKIRQTVADLNPSSFHTVAVTQLVLAAARRDCIVILTAK